MSILDDLPLCGAINQQTKRLRIEELVRRGD